MSRLRIYQAKPLSGDPNGNAFALIALLRTRLLLPERIEFQRASHSVYDIALSGDDKSEDIVNWLYYLKRHPTDFQKKRFDGKMYFAARYVGRTDIGGYGGVRRLKNKIYDIDVFLGADSREEFMSKFIKHRALLDPRSHVCFGNITPEFLMEYRVPLSDLDKGTLRFKLAEGSGGMPAIWSTDYEVISGQEAAEFECLDIPIPTTKTKPWSSTNRARLRDLAYASSRLSRDQRHTTCDRCGRRDLASTTKIRLHNGRTAHLGSGCARLVRGTR